MGELTKEELDAEIVKSIADIENGRVYSAEEVFDEMHRSYGIWNGKSHTPHRPAYIAFELLVPDTARSQVKRIMDFVDKLAEMPMMYKTYEL